MRTIVQQLVVFTHSPQNWRKGSDLDEATLDILKDYDVELVLTGHRHSNTVDEDFIPGARYIQTTSSAYTIDQTPRGFRYIQMHGSLESRVRMYGYDKSLTITDPAPGSQVDPSGFTDVQVNAYDTADRVTQVTYRLDGGSWAKLKPTGDFTWHVARPGQPELPAGEHEIEVRAVDEAGSVWTERATFEVTDEPARPPRAGGDWAQHHGDSAHLGVAQDEVRPDNLQLAWSHRTADTFLTGSPVIADGVVYAGTRDDSDDGKATFFAVDLVTGEQLWEFPTASSVHGTPAVADGLVYVPTLKGTLYALDARDGELRWQLNPDTPGSPPSDYGQQSYYGVAVQDSKVYYAYQAQEGEARNGLLVALDGATGARLWQAPLEGRQESKGAPAVAEGRVYVGSDKNAFFAFDADTGEQIWKVNRSNGFQDSTPTAADGRLFIGVRRNLVARDAATGEELWNYRSRNGSYVPDNITPSTPAIVGDNVFIGFPDGHVVALDVATGKPRWETRLPGAEYLGGVLSSPTMSGDTLYVGSNNGFLYGLDLQTGEIVWEFEVGAWVATSPAISGNTLVAGAWDGNLYAFTDQTKYTSPVAAGSQPSWLARP